MENEYVKQFPELMKGKKIMYNHGFSSSAASGTVKLIRQTFPNATVVAYDIPLHPADGLALLRQKAKEEKPDLIIGTSMGGMYTELLYGFDRILVNPCFPDGTDHEGTWHDRKTGVAESPAGRRDRVYGHQSP